VWQRIKEIARRRPDGDDDTEADHLTLGDLKWYLVCLGAGFGAAMGLLQLMGKL
jgi:hypothetical protein